MVQQSPAAGIFSQAAEAVFRAEQALEELARKGKSQLPRSELNQAKRLVRQADELLRLIADAGAFPLDQKGGLARLRREADDILETLNADARG